jgi:UDP-glucuronate decarboxylase
LVGGNSVIEQYPSVEDDPQRRKPNITRARTFLNWEPRIPLRDGLKKTIEYFRNELKLE